MASAVVQLAILTGHPEADISLSIVWIPMLEGDTEAAARQAAEQFLPDPRVRHFYDPDRRAGKAIAQSLGGGEGEVAWDIYLFYERGDEWDRVPPLPIDWMHQLVATSWADAARHHRGDDLAKQIYQSMARLIGAQA